MEQFACRSHMVWAWVSFMQAILGAGSFWILFAPALYVLGPMGQYLFGLLLTCGAQVIFGLGGGVFHIFGYLDHKSNIKRLAKRKA